MWKASLGEERHSLALLITEGDSKAPSWEGSLFSLSYSRELKTRNNCGPGSLGTPCHSV
jgi:hypothetical protein